jgi:hypothetical protein
MEVRAHRIARLANRAPVRALVTSGALLAWLASAACSSGSAGPSAPADPYAAECARAGSPPPKQIECIGLFSDVANKVLAPGVRPYAPAVSLWADYATKQRWIYLPPGTTIDNSDPNEWKFPVGTKLFKEFSRDGKRVETRLWWKTQASYWVKATYAWSADEKTATKSAGLDLPWSPDGGLYHIPTGDECDQCHRGRTDHILGFEQVSLGLQGATGLTLAELVKQNLLAQRVLSTSLTVGDDGTGVGAPAMEWLHVNCGVACHNDDSNATGNASDMRLRLDPTQLDGRPTTDFPTRTTTMGMLANNPMWTTEPRIAPGDPAGSLMVKLITNRGTDNPANNQMPPIASYLVDPVDTPKIVEWIGKMTPVADAGVPGDGGGD